MSKEVQKEVRFYVCLGLAYVLLMVSLFIPPVGIIATSVLYATIIIFGMAGLSIGLDISGILHELNEMKRLKIEEFKTDEINK